MSLRYTSFARPGIYRRCIRIETSSGWARADLEDDPHRYAVIVRHDGERVTSIEGLALRTPWDLCRDAAAVLDRLVGMPLSPHPLAVYRHANGRAQCTHMFDLAGLAIAHAARGTRLRRYDVDVPCLNPLGTQRARLARDGAMVLEWTVRGTAILAPEPFAGRDLRILMAWAEAAFPDPDDYEALVVLRRGYYISGSRAFELDGLANAAETGHVSGACFVFQPGVAERARRMPGSTRDFGDRPDALLADLAAQRNRSTP